MRKYYKPRNVRKRNPNQELDREVSPWAILRAYVEGNAGYFDLDTLSRLISACTNKSVKDYLDLSSEIDARAQKYTGRESLEQVFVHRQVAMLLKKYPFVDSNLETDPRSTAIEKWQQAEDQCRKTNQRIKKLTASGNLPSWLPRARKIISDILGDLGPSVIMKIISGGQHGPGSTLTSRGNRTSAYYKYNDVGYSVSSSAKVYAYAAISCDPKWIDFLESTGCRKELPPLGSPRYQTELTLLDQVVGLDNSDKVTFVPKDARTDRPIAVGAGLNLFLQLGVKSYMEERLKSHGVDLTSQTKNQLFAKFGSMAGTDPLNPGTQYSTIDLASASDTISVEIVRLLLDPMWFAFLDDLRHKSGSLEGNHVEYQKFSAMGNGFTFPLESLIFYGISKAAIEDSGSKCSYNDIAVYGDDIIVRYKETAHVISALNWAGFSVNEQKSFLSGPFKESCGKDYFRGTDVRPFYLKRRVRRIKDVYHTINSINLKTIESNYLCGFHSLFSCLLESIPRKSRSYGPMPSVSEEKGIRSFSVSECYLQCDLSYLNRLGLRPWLHRDERSALRASKLLKPTDEFLQCAYVACTEPVAISYRANPTVLYMMKLRSLSDQVVQCKKYDPFAKVPSQGNPGSTTSRRESIKWSTTIRPILHWNGDYRRHELYRSLFEYL